MSDAGLFQGLNEGYDAYRGRQRDIEDENRRKFQDEETQRKSAREQEQYEYGLGQRGVQEQANKLALDTGTLQLGQAQGNYDEWIANTAQRAEQNRLGLKQAQLNMKTAGIVFDEAEISLKSKKGVEKYTDWSNRWNLGMSMEELVKEFNNDTDDFNNILSITGNAEKGWDVVYENGQTDRFEDRDAVAIRLQGLIDPNFQQLYLLQVEKQKADLAVAIEKAAKKTPDILSKEKTTWESMTLRQTDRFFAKTINEGIVDFGTEGTRRIAGDVRAVVDRIGVSSNYEMINSDVTRVANQMAEKMLVKEPALRRKMAEEFLDAKRKAGDAIPKKGDKNYEQILSRQMAEDYDRAYDQYTRAVYTKFFNQGEDGTVTQKDYKTIADFSRKAGKAAPTDIIAKPERPDPDEVIPVPGGDNLTSEEAAANEDALGLPDREIPPDETVAERQQTALKKRLADRETARELKKTTAKKEKAFKKTMAAKLGIRVSVILKPDAKKKLRRDYKNNFKALSLFEKQTWMKYFKGALYSEIRDEAYDIIRAEKKLAKP